MQCKLQPFYSQEFVAVTLKNAKNILNQRLYKKFNQQMEGGYTQKLTQHLVFKGTSTQGKNRLCVWFSSLITNVSRHFPRSDSVSHVAGPLKFSKSQTANASLNHLHTLTLSVPKLGEQTNVYKASNCRFLRLKIFRNVTQCPLVLTQLQTFLRYMLLPHST